MISVCYNINDICISIKCVNRSMDINILLQIVAIESSYQWGIKPSAFTYVDRIILANRRNSKITGWISSY